MFTILLTSFINKVFEFFESKLQEKRIVVGFPSSLSNFRDFRVEVGRWEGLPFRWRKKWGMGSSVTHRFSMDEDKTHREIN